MGKLKLDLNELQVETFDTSPEENEARGTVQGHYVSGEPEFCTDFTICIEICPLPTRGTCASCGNTCGGTCGHSCGGTCASCNTCGGTCTCGNTCGGTCVFCTTPDASCGYPVCP